MSPGTGESPPSARRPGFQQGCGWCGPHVQAHGGVTAFAESVLLIGPIGHTQLRLERDRHRGGWRAARNRLVSLQPRLVAMALVLPVIGLPLPTAIRRRRPWTLSLPHPSRPLIVQAPLPWAFRSPRRTHAQQHRRWFEGRWPEYPHRPGTWCRWETRAFPGKAREG